MRLYFHLRDKEYSIPDREGIEVSDLARAKAAAVQVLRELRREDASVVRDWSGWTLDVADPAGNVLLSIELDRALG